VIKPPNELIQWLLDYRYFILFPIVAIEGPIATLIAGFLVFLGKFNFLVVYGLIIAADLAGDTLYYLLGRGGKACVDKWGHRLHITAKRMERLNLHFKRHPG